jgi:hypothetical protein
LYNLNLYYNIQHEDDLNSVVSSDTIAEWMHDVDAANGNVSPHSGNNTALTIGDIELSTAVHGSFQKLKADSPGPANSLSSATRSTSPGSSVAADHANIRKRTNGI